MVGDAGLTIKGNGWISSNPGSTDHFFLQFDAGIGRPIAYHPLFIEGYGGYPIAFDWVV